MRKVSSFSIGALAVLLLTVLLLGCGGGRSAPTGSNLKSMPAGRTVDLNETLAELDALQAPAGVDPTIFNQLKEAFRTAFAGRGKIVCTPPANTVNDLAESDPTTAPPTVTWSANFFRGDGDGDGIIAIGDITPIAFRFGQDITAHPEFMYADYNESGSVEIGDITPVAFKFAQSVGSFNVEYCETETGTYIPAGNVLWGDALPDLNANGFKAFNYQFGAGVLPAVASVWVHVIPLDRDGAAGVASDPIEVLLNVTPPVDFYITGLRISVTNTTNTDAADLVNVGTINYVAPAGGGNTTGEVMSNALIVMDLKDVYYLWKGNPYGPDDALPADLTQTQLDDYITAAKGYMNYVPLSIDTVEGWTDSAVQPPTGHEGRVGPNDDLVPPNMDGLAIVATMADNEMTQGVFSPSVSILLDQIEDPNAPEIINFIPLEQPQNVTGISTIRLDFGADEIGDELPVNVELHDAATGALEFSFNPAATVETMAPPDNAGEYTIQRFPITDPFSAILQVKVDATTLDPALNYVWRVSVSKPSDAGFERKSSLKKPGDVLDIIGPQLFDMSTWPEEEFYYNDARQPWLYFVPKDPLIRRNPLQHRDLSVPPVFVADDPAAFTDLVKSAGNEFMNIPGYSETPPTPPDSPMVYYSYGLVPPPDVASADGQVPIPSRQPNLLAGVAGGDGGIDTEGDISFSLFSKEGTYLGGVTRYVAGMQITRSAATQVDGDFGVRPWGPAGDQTTLDFTDKTASIGNADVVVFSFYNLWLRHDDGTGLPQDQQGTHVILTEYISGAPLPTLKLKPGMLGSEFNGALCYMTLDVSQTQNIWFQNMTQPIPTGEYVVSIDTPGPGGFDYTDHLYITP